MAQPVGQLFEYLGGVHIKANTTISTASAPTGANAVIYKSEKGRASVDGTDAFTVKYGEVTYFSNTSIHTYTFTEDCEIAFAKIISVSL